jgi:hypothetical protein
MSSRVFCTRCGKGFASQASVQNHQKQLTSNCWKNYSILLEFRQTSIETSEVQVPTSPPQSSPLPTPSSPPEVNMECLPTSLPSEADMETDNLLHQQEDIHHHTEYFLGASEVFGKGDTYMDLFNEDDHAAARERNLYYPFASHPEWELASFLLKSDLSRGMIDEFLKLQLVNITYSISLRLISMFFRFKKSGYHSKPPKTSITVQKYYQLSSLTHARLILDKTCSG